MKIWKFIKRSVFEILAVISFILLLLLVYFFFTTPSFYNYKIVNNENLFAGIMSVVSAIILFAAFWQSRNANNRENSYVFYQEELKNIDVLIENSQKDRQTNTTKDYHKFFHINHKGDVKFENTTNYFNTIYKALNKDLNHELENYKKLNDIGRYNAFLLNMNNIAEYVYNYVKHIAMINNEVENIRKLETRNKLISSHAELLYTKIFSLLKDFFLLVNGIDGKKNQMFELEVPVSSFVIEKEFVQPAKTKLFRTEQLFRANNLLDFLHEYENKVIVPI